MDFQNDRGNNTNDNNNTNTNTDTNENENTNENEDEIEKKNKNESENKEDKQEGEEALSEMDIKIKKSLIVGDYERAVSLSLSTGNIADALVFAYYGDEKLWQKTISSYFAQHKNKFISQTFQNIVANDMFEIVNQSDINKWNETLAILITFGMNSDDKEHEKTFLKCVNTLGNRLLEQENIEGSIMCFMITCDIYQLVNVLTIQAENQARLNKHKKTDDIDFTLYQCIVKTLIFVNSPHATNSRCDLTPLYNLFCQYATLLANQVSLDTASEFLCYLTELKTNDGKSFANQDIESLLHRIAQSDPALANKLKRTYVTYTQSQNYTQNQNPLQSNKPLQAGGRPATNVPPNPNINNAFNNRLNDNQGAQTKPQSQPQTQPQTQPNQNPPVTSMPSNISTTKLSRPTRPGPTRTPISPNVSNVSNVANFNNNTVKESTTSFNNNPTGSNFHNPATNLTSQSSSSIPSQHSSGPLPRRTMPSTTQQKPISNEPIDNSNNNTNNNTMGPRRLPQTQPLTRNLPSTTHAQTDSSISNPNTTSQPSNISNNVPSRQLPRQLPNQTSSTTTATGTIHSTTSTTAPTTTSTTSTTTTTAPTHTSSMPPRSRTMPGVSNPNIGRGRGTLANNMVNSNIPNTTMNQLTNSPSMPRNIPSQATIAPEMLSAQPTTQTRFQTPPTRPVPSGDMTYSHGTTGNDHLQTNNAEQIVNNTNPNTTSNTTTTTTMGTGFFGQTSLLDDEKGNQPLPNDAVLIIDSINQLINNIMTNSNIYDNLQPQEQRSLNQISNKVNENLKSLINNENINERMSYYTYSCLITMYQHLQARQYENALKKYGEVSKTNEYKKNLWLPFFKQLIILCQKYNI